MTFYYPSFFIFFAAILHGQSQPQMAGKIPDDSKLSVVIFLATDCPISQKYIPALNAIQQNYAHGDVNVLALIPGKVKKSDLKKFKQEYDIGFAVSPDPKYEWTKALSATATPEVFVFDNNNKLKYRGAIDNWFFELGGYRQEPTENYLIDSIESLLTGKEPEIVVTKAIGCLIQTP